MIEQLYFFAQRVYADEIKQSDAKNILAFELNINPATAQAHFEIYKKMRMGAVYKRATSSEATDYFINHIYLDLGRQGLANAICATQKHIEYYSKKYNTHVVKIQNIVYKYQIVLSEIEQ